MNEEINAYLNKKLNKFLIYEILFLILGFMAYIYILKTTDLNNYISFFLIMLSWIVSSNAVCFIMHGMGINKIYEVHNFAIGKEVKNKQESFLIDSYQNGKVSIKNKDNNSIQEISLEKLFKSYKFV